MKTFLICSSCHWCVRPGIAEELGLLSFFSPYEPLSKGRVHEHTRPVPSLDQEHRQVLHPLLEVVPVQRALDRAAVDGLVDLLVGERMQWSQGHVEQRQGSVEGRLREEAHVTLQEVHLGQTDRHHLVVGALEHQIAALDQVEGQLQVEQGALAEGLEVGAELAEAGVVHLAVEGDVVLDLCAAVDAVKDVALQVVVDGVVLLQSVQRDLMEGQRFGDVLQRRDVRSATSKIRLLNVQFSTERKVQ